MNDRVPAALWTAFRSDADELATIRVDRARTELRHGRPIALQEVPDGPWLLAVSVEALGAARLQALRRDAPAIGALRLLLTAERLEALRWPDATVPRALQLAPGATVEQVQALAAVSAGGVDRSLLGAGPAADAAMLAALDLCKRARLTPALLVAEVPALQAQALEAAQVLRLGVADVARVAPAPPALRRVSDAHVPIAAHEDCTLILFREIEGDVEHIAIVVGQPAPQRPVAVRLHSSCLTGDLLGSLRCDCGDQLRRAIDHLAVDGGVLLYLAQEGRGTGLANKLRAYRLQDAGLDTLQADRHLGFRDEERDFRVAAAMLEALGIARIRLLTNNPQKIAALREAGIDVVDRVPLLAPVNSHNARYLQTKRDHAGHLHPGDDAA